MGCCSSIPIGRCNGKRRREIGMVASASPLHIIHNTHTVRFDKAVRKSVSFNNTPTIVPPPEEPQEASPPPTNQQNHPESPITPSKHVHDNDTILETIDTRPAPNGHGHHAHGGNLYVSSPLPPAWDEKERRREYFSREYHYYPTPLREGIYNIATDANRLTTIFSEENPNACSIV
ncbi:hypothetical protein IHE45_17G102100 [Dioscorea alata]|uniref:Uncharacterized protein n=1 Tax=Dioscorea alata TaxID=55571 RepID=A0ACB7UEB9_DIOAL|nr:hypothetical protein IHE45_17G102100 [Dioscorea alata]